MRTAAHAKQRFRTLEIHACRRIGDVPVSAVTSADVLDILTPSGTPGRWGDEVESHLVRRGPE